MRPVFLLALVALLGVGVWGHVGLTQSASARFQFARYNDEPGFDVSWSGGVIWDAVVQRRHGGDRVLLSCLEGGWEVTWEEDSGAGEPGPFGRPTDDLGGSPGNSFIGFDPVLVPRARGEDTLFSRTMTVQEFNAAVAQGIQEGKPFTGPGEVVATAAATVVDGAMPLDQLDPHGAHWNIAPPGLRGPEGILWHEGTHLTTIGPSSASSTDHVARRLEAGGAITAAGLGDWDGDGVADVLIAVGNKLELHRGRIDGTLARPEAIDLPFEGGGTTLHFVPGARRFVVASRGGPTMIHPVHRGGHLDARLVAPLAGGRQLVLAGASHVNYAIWLLDERGLRQVDYAHVRLYAVGDFDGDGVLDGFASNGKSGWGVIRDLPTWLAHRDPWNPMRRVRWLAGAGAAAGILLLLLGAVLRSRRRQFDRRKAPPGAEVGSRRS